MFSHKLSRLGKTNWGKTLTLRRFLQISEKKFTVVFKNGGKGLSSAGRIFAYLTSAPQTYSSIVISFDSFKGPPNKKRCYNEMQGNKQVNVLHQSTKKLII